MVGLWHTIHSSEDVLITFSLIVLEAFALISITQLLQSPSYNLPYYGHRTSRLRLSSSKNQLIINAIQYIFLKRRHRNKR